MVYSPTWQMQAKQANLQEEVQVVALELGPGGECIAQVLHGLLAVALQV